MLCSNNEEYVEGACHCLYICKSVVVDTCLVMCIYKSVVVDTCRVLYIYKSVVVRHVHGAENVRGSLLLAVYL